MKEIMTTIVLFITMSVSPAISADKTATEEILHKIAQKTALEHDIPMEIALEYLNSSLEADAEKDSFKKDLLEKIANQKLTCAITASILKKFPKKDFENAMKTAKSIPERFIAPLNKVGNAMSLCNASSLEVHTTNIAYHQNIFSKKCFGKDANLKECASLADNVLRAAERSLDNIELWTPIAVPISLARAIEKK